MDINEEYERHYSQLKSISKSRNINYDTIRNFLFDCDFLNYVDNKYGNSKHYYVVAENINQVISDLQKVQNVNVKLIYINDNESIIHVSIFAISCTIDKAINELKINSFIQRMCSNNHCCSLALNILNPPSLNNISVDAISCSFITFMELSATIKIIKLIIDQNFASEVTKMNQKNYNNFVDKLKKHEINTMCLETVYGTEYMPVENIHIQKVEPSDILKLHFKTKYVLAEIRFLNVDQLMQNHSSVIIDAWYSSSYYISKIGIITNNRIRSLVIEDYALLSANHKYLEEITYCDLMTAIAIGKYIATERVEKLLAKAKTNCGYSCVNLLK